MQPYSEVFPCQNCLCSSSRSYSLTKTGVDSTMPTLGNKTQAVRVICLFTSRKNFGEELKQDVHD
ncbi:hypothetical protein C1752_01882 [Acaryochloris thomasi RCC1774]|uniref:Uncharacterized protein n=1 Tax=Acaryochloris thomasi RCC1774 TaxID=1764569 RepID=A0A2W1JKC5_9CYAN|nr:hypothetical protein C1752_01882 [Acaryochloris thomasi RCC1774]